MATVRTGNEAQSHQAPALPSVAPVPSSTAHAPDQAGQAELGLRPPCLQLQRLWCLLLRVALCHRLWDFCLCFICCCWISSFGGSRAAGGRCLEKHAHAFRLCEWHDAKLRTSPLLPFACKAAMLHIVVMHKLLIVTAPALRTFHSNLAQENALAAATTPLQAAAMMVTSRSQQPPHHK